MMPQTKVETMLITMAAMTPLNQDLSPAEKDELAARPAKTVTVDLHVTACRWEE